MAEYGLVSVITPSYNTARYLAETIRSVQNQSYVNWELIIVDDCSSDDTDAVVAPFLEDRRIRYLKNERNSGAALSRNYGLREARGRWIAFLDSDDVWLPQKLEKQLAFMMDNGYRFSYTCYEEMDEASEPRKVRVSGPKKVTKGGMYRYCWPGCLTVMYDREAIGLIQIENIPKNNDYAMWLQICHRADCYLLPELLARYRRGRKGSISTQGYGTMILWHYRMFRICQKQGPALAAVCTLGNLVWGVVKKLVYVKRG